MAFIKITLHKQLEHTIKHIGTITSGVYAILFSTLLIYIDLKLNQWGYGLSNSLETYTRLIPVTNVLLSIIIGISLTTFSVIFVVMQLASSQFSPRILRHFLANDVKVQNFIGYFVGTIALCIIPQLVSVFFPKESFIITLIVGTALALRGLVWSYPRMITHLSINMNVSSITHHIKKEVADEIEILYTNVWQKGHELTYQRLQSNGNSSLIKIRSQFESGYLESINYNELEKGLLELKSKYGWQAVYQKPVVGEFIMKNTTILLQIEVDEIISSQIDAFSALVHRTFHVNLFRSHTQDVNFGVRKLVDIAIKAISPAVNDPTTCINCIDQLGEIVKVLSEKQFPSTDARNLIKSNIHINEFNFDEFIDFCFDQIYQWGKEDPVVIKRILRTIRAIIPTIQNPYHLKILLKEVEDMELESIYSLNNSLSSRIGKEKLITIQKEIMGFKSKAKKQIVILKENGILDFYTQEHHSTSSIITNIQKETIEYLNNY